MQYSMSNLKLLSNHKQEKAVTNQDSEVDKVYKELIDSEIENLLQSEETYQFQSTPLKPAKAIKEDHKRQLKEELEQRELRGHIVQAYDLIMNQLPQKVSLAEFDQLKGEFEKSVNHFDDISQKPAEFIDQLSSLQEIYGISDESMTLIYSLAYGYLEKREFKNADSLLYFLTLLNPTVRSFWIALGISLQNQGKYEESKIMFETAQTLDSDNPEAFILGAQVDLQLNNSEMAQEQLKIAEKIINHSNHLDNKQDLINQINNLIMQINLNKQD